MSLDEKFQLGLKFIQSSTDSKLSNEVKLRFYALYKVATDGPCTAKAPSRVKMVEYAKWKAYSSIGDKYTKEQAKEVYIQELSEKMPGWDAKL